MRLYKRKGSAKWWTTWNDKTGKRHRKSTGTDDKALAEALAAKWQQDSFLERHFGAIPDTPFSEALIRYAQDKKRDNPSTYETNVRYVLQRHLDWFDGLNLSEINTRVIADFASKRRATVKDASAQRDLAVLKAILNKAYREGLLAAVPAFPRMRKPKGRQRWITLKEERQLMQAAAPHLKPMIALAVDTGGRRSELLGLDWRQVDLERGFITFVNTKNGEDRSVRLTGRGMQILSSLKPKLAGPVLTYKGQAIRSIKSAFDTARTKAKIDDLRFHDLRHTFASRLVQQGIPLYEVMQLTGHKSLEMVQRYAHLSPDFQDRAIQALNEYGTVSAQRANNKEGVL